MRRDNRRANRVCRATVKLFPRLDPRIHIPGVAPHHGDDALETHDLTGASFPAPGPFQRAELRSAEILAVDLQRRCGRHGETLARMPGTPNAEILLNAAR